MSYRSEFRAKVTNVAFIRSPEAVAGGRPPGMFGVVPTSVVVGKDVAGGRTAPGGEIGGARTASVPDLSVTGGLGLFGPHEVPGSEEVGMDEEVRK